MSNSTDKSQPLSAEELAELREFAFDETRAIAGSPMHRRGSAVLRLLNMVERLQRAVCYEESQTDWDGGYCTVCGGGVMYGSRHSQCGRAVMDAVAKAVAEERADLEQRLAVAVEALEAAECYLSLVNEGDDIHSIVCDALARIAGKDGGE